MGLSKTASFSTEQNRIAELAKALAHPARVAIVQHLLKSKACVCGDLVDVLPLSQSTVSQHLKAMKSAGIITGSVEPPKVCYCLNMEVLREFREAFGEMFSRCC